VAKKEIGKKLANQSPIVKLLMPKYSGNVCLIPRKSGVKYVNT